MSSPEIPIADNFLLFPNKKLGSGAFGEIYKGLNTITNEEIAIKLEPIKVKHPQLINESKIYISLQNGIGIPEIYCCGTQGNYNFLIITSLGNSLEDLFNLCNRKFSLKTSLLIIDQILTRIEFIHSKNFIHRDIKPDNFLIGKNKKNNIIYIIDFGLSKKYKDKNNFHISYRDGKNLTGTERFASINTHLGIEQSRRDDLESLGYVLLYFLRGSLPWQGLKAKTINEKYNKIMKTKIQTSLSNLCKGFPSEIEKFLHYTRDLTFDETPDYNFLHKLLKDICDNNNIQLDNIFDWTIKLSKKAKKKEGKILNEKEM